MSISNKYILPVLIVMGGAVLLLTITNSDFKSNQKLIEVIAPLSKCKPQQQVCAVSNDSFEFKVKFDKEIYYLKPFSVSVNTTTENETKIKSIQVDFKMKGMDMGVNRFNLVKKDVTDNDISWEGKSVLPICVTGRIDWVSELEIVSAGKKYIYAFPMQVIKAKS